MRQSVQPGEEISWARFSRIFPIGDTLNNLYNFLQQHLRLWFLPVKWSVSQPLVSPVVGSSQPLCKKLSIFWHFSVFRSFFVDFLRNFRALSVLILITHVSGNESFGVVFFVPYFAHIFRRIVVHFFFVYFF